MAKCPFNKYKECQESDSRYCYCTLPCDVYNNYKNKRKKNDTRRRLADHLRASAQKEMENKNERNERHDSYGNRKGFG